ncbi:MAG TPA: methyltransferase, partial [Gammaproteobacteria bacterium]|nr:methyltransferase [Gammaproteobacteria bacterium]
LAAVDVEHIHQATLETLATIGLADAPPSCSQLVTGAGGTVTGDGRLLFPRALVEDTVALAARNIVLHGQDPRHDMEL